MSSEDYTPTTTSRADIDAAMVRFLPLLRRQVYRRAGSLHYGHFDVEDVVQHAYESALKQCRHHDPERMDLDRWVVTQMCFAARNATAECIGKRGRIEEQRKANSARFWLRSRGMDASDEAVDRWMGWTPGATARLVDPAVLSLDWVVPGEDGVGWLYERIAADLDDPDDVLDREIAHQALIDATTNLRDALVVRYILDGENNAEVGRWFGLSKERVRQILSRTVRRATEALDTTEVTP